MKAYVYHQRWQDVVVIIADNREEADQLFCQEYDVQSYEQAFKEPGGGHAIRWRIEVEEKELVKGELFSIWE